MKPEEFNKHLSTVQIAIKGFVNKDAPRIAANVAVNHFKENFQKQGFEKKKWKEVKRRKSSKVKGARSTRKILTGNTGDLGRSFEKPTFKPSTALIISDLPYSAVHNLGLRAGRGKGFRMPKRQFMGESEMLNKITTRELEKKLKIKIS